MAEKDDKAEKAVAGPPEDKSVKAPAKVKVCPTCGVGKLTPYEGPSGQKLGRLECDNPSCRAYFAPTE